MRLFIGCSSCDNIPKEYIEDSILCLNKLLINNDVVVGISDSGITKMAYEIAKKYGNKVTGVCTDYHKDTFLKLACDSEFVVNHASLRTQKLIDEADAIIFLYGGFGSVQEIFSVLEEKRSGEFDKPVIIYNNYHFYDELLRFMDSLYKENFVSEDVRNCYYITDSVDDILMYLDKYKKEL